MSVYIMRVIHNEIAHSLDTNSFLNAFRQFIRQCSNPEHIHTVVETDRYLTF